jgi:hypothetical protein
MSISSREAYLKLFLPKALSALNGYVQMGAVLDAEDKIPEVRLIKEIKEEDDDDDDEEEDEDK